MNAEKPDQNAGPLSPDMLRKINDYFNAANYLSVGQIYLYDNPLLKKPLSPEDIKPRLLGHWGTTPGLNFIYVHMNRVIKKYDLDMIFVTGPGHGGPALVANTYLEGKEKVLEGLEKGLMYRKEDGSVWADLTGEGLDQKLLLRSDGTSVYMTQDIGTAKLRYQDYPIDKMIYVVGNEQNYHFQVLSILLDRLGFKWGKDLVHFSYGMVELPEGKMKSREGTVVDADDLMDEMIATAKATSEELGKLDGCSQDEADNISRIIGLGALKYFILKVDPRKNMTFNPKESIDFNGNTGPFIQYTYARIQSVLRKAAEQGICTCPDIAACAPNDKEVALIQRIADFGNVVADAGKSYSPAQIANYTYDLVKEYNQFYHDFSILREEDGNVRALRLLLSKNVGEIIRRGMALLGIEVPDRM